MSNLVIQILVYLVIILSIHVVSEELHRRNGICSWMVYENTACLKTKFLCSNKQCIERRLLCNGIFDCEDHSDEEGYCPDRCDGTDEKRCDSKCIPSEWFCDGIADCDDGADEDSCDKPRDTFRFDTNLSPLTKAIRWLYNQSKLESTTEVSEPFPDKFAIALYFTVPRFGNAKSDLRRSIAYEVTIQLLSSLYRTKLEDIPSTDLASFVNAFLVSCIDPRKFHGIDIVQELRNRVDKENYTNPYLLLSLCNAGERITESDKAKLIDTFWNERQPFWTDIQAYAIMALVCARKQSGNDVTYETLRQLTLVLKERQYRNGTVENLQTTALVMQVSEPDGDPDNFDERKALEQITSNQKPDGSFGNVLNTYFVLPVLSCKSFVNISSDHCESVKRDEMSALEDLTKREGPKKRVQYSIWIGDKKDFERNLVLQVPLNMSFYGIMEIAAEVDNKYSFRYVVKDRKPYINTISNLRDNPEKEKFWFLYRIKDEKTTLVQENPADVLPVDNDHFVMWYRSGPWVN